MRYVSLLLFLIVASVVGLVGWQNLPTRVNVVFKLTPNLAWDLGPQGQPLVWLLAGAFVGGALIAAIAIGGRGAAARSEARRLQRELDSLQDELDFHKGSKSSAL